jgi:hypothetical protein
VRTNRNLITSPTNYVESGYDPDDGLTGGRWMRDTWGVVRWVQIEECKIRRPRECAYCGTRVSKSATSCRPCNLAIQRNKAAVA